MFGDEMFYYIDSADEGSDEEDLKIREAYKNSQKNVKLLKPTNNDFIQAKNTNHKNNFHNIHTT